MGTIQSITIQLAPADYARLKALARERNITPEALAQSYVQDGLTGTGETDAERRRCQGLAALEGFRMLRERLRREGYPSVDAVEVARQAREELEQRQSY